ncbi:hypothetical protein LPJ53_001752 [Coemansia erecta]|uniref:DUF3533 domain-containing protein n=1 Tax=Coemansia erecta TaxID=147472 RepID=A0A9W8CU78_9FUNG|nr:hypothetical protein LPJ53_001752 [Coemansia erecta]
MPSTHHAHTHAARRIHTYFWVHQPDLDHGRIGLFDSTFRHTFKQRTLYHLRLLVIYSALLWVVLAIFYGCVYNMTAHAHRIHLKIIDLDQSSVSRRLTAIMLEQDRRMQPDYERPWVPQWSTLRHHRLHTLSEAKEHVRHHEWAAIVINRGLETNLRQALLGASAEYSPSSAMTALVSTGRNPIPISRYIQPALDAMAQYAAHEYARLQVADLHANSDTLLPQGNLSQANVQALLTPIWYTDFEVSPCSFGIAPIAPLFAVFVSLACTLATQVLVKLSSVELYDIVNHHHLAIALHLLMLLWSTILGLFGALAFLAFRGPQYNALRLGLPINAARFFAIMFTFDAAILASSQWIFFWVTVLPPDLVPLALITLMVPSSASSTVSLDLVPGGLRWIAAIPAHNSAMLFRTITSGAYPRVAINVGVLAAEIAFMFIVNMVIIMVRQDWLLAGHVDAAGWYRKSIFFKPPPRYVVGSEHEEEEEEEEESDALSLTTTHTINILDDSETPEGIQYTLYGR